MSNIATVPSHVSGDPFTAAMWSVLQQNINDAIVNQVCAARVYNTGNIGTSAALVALSFNTERYDGDNMHSSANPTQLIAQTAGVYRIGGAVEWPTDSGSGRIILALRLNGSTVIAKDMKHAEPVTNTAHVLAGIDFFLNQGDYVEFLASSQNSLTIQSSADYSPEFWMSRV